MNFVFFFYKNLIYYSIYYINFKIIEHLIFVNYFFLIYNHKDNLF
jgi:hypothetical protein